MTAIPCASIVRGDTITYRESVWSGSWSRPVHAGDRWITAEVLRESYGRTGQHTFTLRVLNSTGVEPLSPGSIIRRKGRNLYRHGVTRALWADEAARLLVADEKHARGTKARLKEHSPIDFTPAFP